MGNQRGRLCLIHQIDLEDDSLVWETHSRNGRISGRVENYSDFVEAITEMMAFHATDRLEAVLKMFRLEEGLSGICPKSFPRSRLSSELLSLINLSIGGESGVQLVQLPFEGALVDQPNLFMEGYSIFVDEHYKWISKVRKEQDAKNRTPDR